MCLCGNKWKGKLESTRFFDKGNLLISRDTNYTQPLELSNTIMAVRMGPTEKGKETKKRKDPLQYSSPSSNNTSTTKTTCELQALQK
jgi:hypothetical protein